ncbi:MAG: proprotein convertase P-domain-containing protein [Planctomycetota bacterium]|nr:proprotein convertase P-domain-containing protein [Planctomycetota bacterium]
MKNHLPSYPNRNPVRFPPFLAFCLVVGLVLVPGPVWGQAGLRETLDRMDKNKNGYIDPDEVTTLARPYLERILGDRYGRRRPVDFDDPIAVSRIQEAARYYYSVKNGSQGSDVRPEGENDLKDFQLGWNDPIVPEFGVGSLRFPYTRADLNEADNTMRRCDSNRDGFIDRAEAGRNRWTHRNPFADDLNKDGKLTRLELAQRYARRRLVAEDSGELWKKSIRTGSGVKPSVKSRREQYMEYYRERRDTSTRLSTDLFARFDRNRDRSLDEKETEALGIPFRKLDINNDGKATKEEIQEVMSFLQTEASDTLEGLPDWFMELDSNKDGQIEMAEFSEEWTKAKLKEFESYDLNSDGLMTAEEVIKVDAGDGGSYVQSEAQVIAPKKTIISEIEIEENIKIGDLKVSLSLTHTMVGQLDGFLTGPDGQRIELFTGVGGTDDNFVNTLFDDNSQIPITKMRPPFTGSFRPEALDRKQPGLAHYKGKSAKGVWQLVIRGSRSTRFGMLHKWGLIIQPEE